MGGGNTARGIYLLVNVACSWMFEVPAPQALESHPGPNDYISVL